MQPDKTYAVCAATPLVVLAAANNRMIKAHQLEIIISLRRVPFLFFFHFISSRVDVHLKQPPIFEGTNRAVSLNAFVGSLSPEANDCDFTCDGKCRFTVGGWMGQIRKMIKEGID